MQPSSNPFRDFRELLGIEKQPHRIPTEALEFLGSYSAMAASAMMALKLPYGPLIYTLYTLSTIFLIWFATRTGAKHLRVSQIVFFVISVVGLINWS